MEPFDSWVIVIRREKEWLDAEGYGDDVHELSHPNIGERFRFA